MDSAIDNFCSISKIAIPRLRNTSKLEANCAASLGASPSVGSSQYEQRRVAHERAGQ